MNLTSTSQCLLVLLLVATACSGAQDKEQTVQVGREVPAEAGAENLTIKPAAVTDADVKAAARAARRAQKRRERPLAGGRQGQAGQQAAAPEDADEPEDEAQAAQAPEEEELPTDPSPPATVAAPADVAMPPADAKVSATGLVTKVLKAGTGVIRPTPGSKVVVHYSGWTTNGKLFDSSVVRGQPLRIPLGSVIPGWREGVQAMVEGEKRRMWIPEKLAYQGRAGAPAGMLVFDVELLRIE